MVKFDCLEGDVKIKNMDNNIAIVVPCYNEFNRLPKDEFVRFLQQTSVCKIVFSNDGSTDKTIQLLKEIQQVFPERVYINDIVQNGGKAKAVHSGVLYCFEQNIEFEKIAFLDSDLATSLEECLSISNQINNNVIFAFASRIQKIDNVIDRKLYRHLIGRIIATMISIILGIAVYDTQCGCKIFTRQLANDIFKDEFLSKWLFDVELFFRIKHKYGKDNIPNICREIPLQRWVDKDESKVKLSYSLKLWYDLYKINKKYNRQG